MNDWFLCSTMREYFYVGWAFIFFGIIKHSITNNCNSTKFYFRPGKVYINFLEDLQHFQNIGGRDIACSVSNEAGSIILTPTLLKNGKCPPRKPVLFSFMSSYLPEIERETFPGNSIPKPDCAINMSQKSYEHCKPYPLAECVDIWDFWYIDGTATSYSLTISSRDESFNSSQNTVQYSINCTCDVLRKILSSPVFASIKVIYERCILSDNKRMLIECRSLQLMESGIRNITMNKMINVVFDSMSAHITSGDSHKDFFISLPSGSRDALALSPKGHNVTVEVSTDALDEVKISGGGHHIGAFWFREDLLFPVNKTEGSLLTNPVALDMGKDVSNLKSPVNFTFPLLNTTLNSSLQCVFWDVKDEITAYWNSSGCKTIIVEGKIICSCNHLSVFGVLLTPVGVVKPLRAKSLYILTLLSRIGCSVSTAFCLLTLLTHSFYQKGPSENSLWIHLHVCVSLFLLNLSFLINDFLAALRIPEVCVAMAALTHYAELSLLTWFAIEGLHLYLLFIRVFNIHIRRYLLKLGILGWGLPAVPVAVAVGLKLYGEAKIEDEEGGSTSMCFIKKENLIPQILTYCYFLLVMLFNVTMFSVVLRQLMKARMHSPLPKDKGLNRGMVLSLLALSWMLGISWGIMMFSAIAPLQEITFYLFSILSGLHGFFLFLRYCTLLRKEKIANSSFAASMPQSSK